MSEPLVLPRNCGNCGKYDGDGYCALKQSELLIMGYIIDAKRVVCEKHEVVERDEDGAPL